MEKIGAAVEENQTFLIMTHAGLDGDALGSVLAFSELLGALGKRGLQCHLEPIPDELLFLPGVDSILTDYPRDREIDVAVMLDLTDPARLTPGAQFDKDSFRHVINIDHHVSNTSFGTINWVDTRISSVGEMIYRFIKTCDYPITPAMATLLYTAILTDTGSFNYANTTGSTLGAAADLVEAGAMPHRVADCVYCNYSLRRLRLLSKALDTIRIDDSFPVASMVVTRKMIRGCGCSFCDTDGFINYMLSLKEAQVVLLFRQLDRLDEIKVGLRAKGDSCDVNAVANLFGGGGHRLAAGCVVKGELEEVKKRVVKAVIEHIPKS